MRPRLPLRLALATAIVSALTGVAEAHAFLDHAAPAVGSTTPPPPELTLWFTEEVEPAFSGVTVTNAAGDRVDAGKIAIDPRDPQELHLALINLPPGVYEVQWHVVSVDTHRTEGKFSFTVAPGGSNA
jgi:methionine-rich copper-binding protein CopC